MEEEGKTTAQHNTAEGNTHHGSGCLPLSCWPSFRLPGGSDGYLLVVRQTASSTEPMVQQQEDTRHPSTCGKELLFMNEGVQDWREAQVCTDEHTSTCRNNTKCCGEKKTWLLHSKLDSA